jgi:hypothetical protein
MIGSSALFMHILEDGDRFGSQVNYNDRDCHFEVMLR